jgi:cholesterol transport system auxiliary component
MKHAVFGLMLLTVLGACGGSSAPERYNLTPRALELPACEAPRAGLKILEPNAAPGIDSWRIAVLDRPRHMTHYTGVAWTSAASRMVQYYLADSLEQSGRFRSVSTDMDTLPADYALQSELRDFHVDLTSPSPRLAVRLTVTVTATNSNRIVKIIPLTESADLAGKDLQGIIASFDEAMYKLTTQLLEQLSTVARCR